MSGGTDWQTVLMEDNFRVMLTVWGARTDIGAKYNKDRRHLF